uniref:Cell division control protein 73 C-terminal domain-containing protein n=1 Tax=Grammatophora oceanica TaxID=210454 RepID=A0A7S1YH94_9STRA
MTNEQVLDNLNVVVDKRLEGLSEMDQEIHQALSAKGFEVPNLTPEGRKQVQELTQLEIPVGNSASILRPAPGRDFRKALELYQETMDRLKNAGKKGSKKGSSAADGSSSKMQHLRGKRPIIIIPKGMKPPLTMLNAFEFFGNRKYLARDKVLALKRAGKQTSPPSTTFRHALDARNGKGTVEFELMDNPKNKLGHDMKEWDRVVCVVSLGAAWQFKDWPQGFNNPVDLFGRTKGVFFSMEGDKIPAELQKWRVQQFKLHRDKRGMDSVVWASFWKNMEEFMAVKKRELLPDNE